MKQTKVVYLGSATYRAYIERGWRAEGPIADIVIGAKVVLYIYTRRGKYNQYGRVTVR